MEDLRISGFCRGCPLYKECMEKGVDTKCGVTAMVDDALCSIQSLTGFLVMNGLYERFCEWKKDAHIDVELYEKVTGHEWLDKDYLSNTKVGGVCWTGFWVGERKIGRCESCGRDGMVTALVQTPHDGSKWLCVSDGDV